MLIVGHLMVYIALFVYYKQNIASIWHSSYPSALFNV